MKKSKLATKVSLAQKDMHRRGQRSSIELHPRRKEIEADLFEAAALSKAGQRVTIAWLAEIHLAEEYGLTLGREAVRRYAKKHLSLIL